MWYINDDSAVPPFPSEIPPFLKPGCWIVQLDPTFSYDFDATFAEYPTLSGWTIRYLGTLRAEKTKRYEGDQRRSGPWLRVSGDLYIERQDWTVRGKPTPPELPRPSKIPIFPLQDYALYFTLQDYVVSDAGGIQATIATFRFDRENMAWGPREFLTANLIHPDVTEIPKRWQHPRVAPYLRWDLRNDRGNSVGTLDMGWVSPQLRRAEIEFAVAAGLEPPLDNGEGVTLQGVFRRIGWNVQLRGPIPAQGPADVWEERELHARMLELRSPVNLDRQWLYHVLVVPRFRDWPEYGFGKLYDVGALDTNLVPREGLVVAAAARFPRDSRFGKAAGQRLGDVPLAAFHNLMHEIGHAMGLLHRYEGQGFMQALIHIATQGTEVQFQRDELQIQATENQVRRSKAQTETTHAQPFPFNLKFEFDQRDELRLRHYPDLWVRPGGVPFEQGLSTLPVPASDAISNVGSHELQLFVQPLRRVVPLGAPVKLQLRLTNVSGRRLPGPRLLSLADGSVSGRVIAPGGQIYPFSAAAPINFVGIDEIAPGQSMYHAETLWRGPKGALFPVPGRYEIEVEATWVALGGVARVGTRCEIKVPVPRSRRHERVALHLLGAEDLAVLLVFRSLPNIGSDPLRCRILAAIRLLRKALKVRQLRALLAPIEARRLADFDLRKAARLIDEKSLMSTSEIEHLLIQVQKAKGRKRKDPGIRRMIVVCRRRARQAVCKDLAPVSLLELAEELLRCS